MSFYKKISCWVIFVFLWLLPGCFPTDEKIEPHPRNEITIPYSMYEYQTYLDLETQQITGFHPYNDWDLGFECSDTGYHVILNYARFMMAVNTGSKDFDAVTGIDGYTFTMDASSGNLDSTTIGPWYLPNPAGYPLSKGDVYVVSRGSDESGNTFGYVKVMFGDYTSGGYQVRFAALDGTNDHQVSVAKDSTVRFVLFSFDNGGSIKATEPPKDSWDLCFTKYSTILYEDDTLPVPYLVRGVYLNPDHLTVSKETNLPFDQITAALVEDYTFSGYQDAIGYDWKEFTDGAYTVLDNLTYLLKTDKDILYKLRFTSFFDAVGDRGYPSFELARIN